jgi:hypothetical protein
MKDSGVVAPAAFHFAQAAGLTEVSAPTQPTRKTGDPDPAGVPTRSCVPGPAIPMSRKSGETWGTPFRF